MNAATSVPTIPRTTERHQPQVPQPPQASLPEPPPQKPVPAALPDSRRRIQQPMSCKDEKGKGRLNIPRSSTEGKPAPSPLPPVLNTSSIPPHRGVRELVIIPPTEKADDKDDYRHPTSPSYASDAEKQSYNGHGIPSENEYLAVFNHPDSIRIGTRNGSSESASDVDEHLRRIIVYLSVFSPFLTIFISLYAFLAVLILLLIDPIRFCIFREPLSKQLERALLPPLRFQLRMIHSFCPAVPQPPTTMLIAISIASPIYSFAIAVASWVAAVFWFYAMILGDPNQSGVRENDGRTAALGVRRWWERWLQKAVGL